MSYDLSIRSDDTRSRSHAYSVVQDLVAAVLHAPVQGTQALLEDPARDQYMEIDLEWCDADGNSLQRGAAGEDGLPAQCNALALHVPYAFIHGNGVDDRAYFEVAHALAAALGWRVYDPQEGRYLDPGAPHPRPRSI